MTIKELEARTGMTRANIRFYEQEGLLAPARLENGYRDYSDADREALEKIKLLRALHLDLNTIRALQAGEAELSVSLEGRLRELEADREALDRAARVCRALRDAGTDYAALDPKPWLEELARDPVSPRFAPPEDRAGPPERYLHPWRRFFARNVDLALYGLPWTAACALVFHLDQPSNLLTRLLESYIAFGLMLVIEPLLLHFWGTTPGKAIFGITVRDSAGAKLSFSRARQRTFALFGRGLGWGIPFYGLYRQWKSCKAWEDGREGWEYDDAGEPEQYRFADTANWRCALCAGVFVLIPALTVLFALQGRLPPNRGPLTEAEFYENCNFYMDRLDVGAGKRLDSEGNWADDSSYGGVVVSIYGGSHTRTVRYSVTLDGSGTVTGAIVEGTLTGESFLWVDQNDALIAALALVGSRSNCLSFRPDKWAGLVPGDWWEYDVTWDGLRLTRTAELENLESDSFGEIVRVQEGKTGRVTQRFEIAVLPG